MIGIDIVFIEEITVILLLIASAVAVLARRLRIPYTVGLVLIGLALSLLSANDIKVSPQIILALLVPPLILKLLFTFAGTICAGISGLFYCLLFQVLS